MQCPQCGMRTQVIEKRGPFRERRCTNAACGVNFSTRELVLLERGPRRRCAKTRLTHFQSSAPTSAARTNVAAWGHPLLPFPSPSGETAGIDLGEAPSGSGEDSGCGEA